MSYNTRRSGNFGSAPQSQSQVPSVGNIGQRRPVANTFVPGGQLNAQNKGGVQMPNQQQQQQQQQQRQVHQQQQQQQQPAAPAQNTSTTVHFRNQNQTQNQNQGYQSKPQQPPQPQQQQQQQPQPQPQPPPQVQVQVKTDKQSAVLPGVNPPNPALENTNGEEMELDAGDTPKKKFWIKGGKISKKEKIRRRNVRLSKMLQPKNAVMILNELVKNTTYAVQDVAGNPDMNQFKASVLVEDVEHIGYGRSKIQAKNSAAETALKHLIVTNKLSEMKKDDEGNEKMDVAEDETQPPLPWQHVASFALYKLFSSWGEDPNKGAKIQQHLNASGGSDAQKPHENKPAKKMPGNPESMNPLMLINQMLPHAQFEEIERTGTPPNVVYSYNCVVNGQNFIGTGTNKKAAKKLAAFGACQKILNVSYPKEVFDPALY